ncbi:TRAP transporter small permease [Treponema sp. SP13]|uniref:TRAP transporter small permease n=1 Tax=Treponema sp. SP13 TaxID=2789742 RepID=UPI003D8A5F86
MFKKIIDSFLKGLDSLNKILLFISTASFFSLCLTQVICRYVFNHSLSWSDQACRYLFCITTFLGTALCVKDELHTTIDILSEIISPKTKLYQKIYVYLIIFFVGIVLIFTGKILSVGTMTQKTTTLPITMGAVYSMIPISAAIICINAIRVIVKYIKLIKNYNTHDGGKTQ